MNAGTCINRCHEKLKEIVAKANAVINESYDNNVAHLDDIVLTMDRISTILDEMHSDVADCDEY